MNLPMCLTCKGKKTIPCLDGLPTPYICSSCGGRGTGLIRLTRDYIEGVKARATKEPFKFISENWTCGYNDMAEKLSPIETDIIKLSMMYQVTATN